MFSETRYALNGDLRVAYRASREGERDMVFVPTWFTNCEVWPEVASVQGWLEAMTSVGRLILIDQPGTGASDPIAPDAMPTLEKFADSITAVLDDLGSDEAVLIAVAGTLAPAALCAAAHPSRITSLVVLEGFADPIAKTADGTTREEFRAAFVAMWGTGEYQHLVNPDMPWNEEIRSAWARVERLSASPRTVVLMWPLVGDVDVRAVLPAIRVPTLVVHHVDDPIVEPTRGRQVAENIPGAKYVELPGRNMYHFVEPWRDSFQVIAEFLTGHQPEVADDRVLATVLFTDIVDSTRRAAEMGDRNWRALLDAHDAIIRAQLTRFRGREVNTSGDGFLATFDGPQRAIRCAMAIRDAVRSLGIEVRAGLHTGEVEIRGDDIGGIAVHIGARISALAGPNDVLVSSTLRDLVIGSGLEFDDRGAHQLKGVPGEWRLFAVAST
ncbi:adenylate/guanylate cyclase domain-containing protein [Mycolicibacterium tusciae]|uniref:Hydrolase n=1 Tax=Mycolicibacterium tusciae TaxID=75922 RepID=A0A1X0JQ75_9MYCO|nr:adenylate/guanylate cyclase domain-containing protein [Mycolicibacterium tusciae]ORB64790.1 hydrolase [Mycolicibacterium tusciae]